VFLPTTNIKIQQQMAMLTHKKEENSVYLVAKEREVETRKNGPYL